MRRHRRILQFVLLILIVPSFVIVGAWDLVSPQSGASTLAVVDGRKITTPQWQESHRRSIEAMSSQLGGQVPFSAFDTPASRVESLDELIGREVTAAASSSAFLSIPDDQIA
ncbi:MAG: SurA N-terminal domain-containing protein, partial [bacterium]